MERAGAEEARRTELRNAAAELAGQTVPEPEECPEWHRAVRDQLAVDRAAVEAYNAAVDADPQRARVRDDVRKMLAYAPPTAFDALQSDLSKYRLDVRDPELEAALKRHYEDHPL